MSCIRKPVGLMCLVTLAAGLAVASDQAALTVDLAKPGPQVSPMLYGLFFEEINHAGDGGLYAELVRNRGFEDDAFPVGWALVEDGGAGSMTIDTAQPLSAKAPRSLRLTISDATRGRVGVANGGYWGIGVTKGKSYDLSLFARCGDGFGGKLSASLENAAGQVYAAATIAGISTDWRRFTCRLTANATDPTARLVIAGASKGTVWLDMVSLFPQDTYRKRPNGMRNDLAGMLADLKPAFIRFPGGCFVEGDKLENAFRWKNTVGDIAERPGHQNLWGYRSTDGLGYHEYLQLCEDLGAEPLFVINCGMSHTANVPLDKLDEWVQDALDAIEYANGPASSKWGALRAKNGHPAPFGLKYMEIGNENGGPAYEERYARFYEVIKKLYPEMKLVANTPVKSAPMDIVDEHYYSSPEWFSSQAHRYDSYPRGGPHIYVGEYACTQGCGQGNLRAALGEAAFMMGMEANSDVVRMASYAPLFVNVNNRAWNPDAICFDSSSCFGTASYQVQKLFAQNRADVIVPSTLQCRTKLGGPSGGIGLSTWQTQAEFRDITVTQGEKTLYKSDFAAGAQGWRVVSGDWKAQDGAFRQTAAGNDLRAVSGDPAWTDYAYSLKARKLGGAEGFLIMFHVRDDSNWLWWNIGGWGNQRHAIEKSAGGKSELGSSVPGSVETGRWYDIRIELKGSRIRCYLDGKLIHDVVDSGPSAMTAVAGLTNQGRELVLKVVNVSDMAEDTQIALEGGAQVAASATAMVLTANSPDDENSFTHPTAVAPVTMPFGGVSRRFARTFPPYSLTILRLSLGGR